MATVNYTLRLDETDKRTAEQIFNDLGLTLAAGFNIYVKAVVRQQKIPFDLALNENKMIPSASEPVTRSQQAASQFLKAMQNLRREGFSAEDEAAINDLQNGKYKPVFEGRL
jgi:DNA-damage-inducible protein J